MLALYQQIIAEDPSFAEAHLVFARVVLGWLDFAAITVAPAGYTAEDTRQLFADVSAAASEHARTEEARLSAEVLRARVQLRLTDLVELTRSLVKLHPDSLSAWREHLDALLLTSRYDEARAFVRRAAARDFNGDEGPATFIAFAARVDLASGLASIEQLLGQSSPSEADYYQAHRIYLHADKVEAAAELARRYIAAATDPTWTLMVKIRQACAEGRVSDAFRFVGIFVLHALRSAPVSQPRVRACRARHVAREASGTQLRVHARRMLNQALFLSGRFLSCLFLR